MWLPALLAGACVGCSQSCFHSQGFSVGMCMKCINQGQKLKFCWPVVLRYERDFLHTPRAAQYICLLWTESRQTITFFGMFHGFNLYKCMFHFGVEYEQTYICGEPSQTVENFIRAVTVVVTVGGICKLALCIFRVYQSCYLCSALHHICIIPTGFFRYQSLFIKTRTTSDRFCLGLSHLES